MKLCKNCKHFYIPQNVPKMFIESPVCSKGAPNMWPKAFGGIEPIFGEMQFPNCLALRFDETKCGYEAKWFEMGDENL